MRRAIGTLVDDLNAGHNIKNPGGLLAISAQEGRTRYFPTTPPQPAADPEALAEMVDAIRTETAESDGHQDFDEQILSLVTTKLAWTHSGLSTIDDLTALFCERGKAYQP